MFLESFVPIGSDGAGGTLFVDLRAGHHSGCVTEYMREDADGGPSWNSVEAMLADVATALATGQPSNEMSAVVEDDELRWEPSDGGWG
jgi:hypothetical protein